MAHGGTLLVGQIVVGPAALWLGIIGLGYAGRRLRHKTP
jgi:hypothetical protein